MIIVIDKKTGKEVRITVKEWWEAGGHKDNKKYSKDLTWKKPKRAKRAAKKPAEIEE